MDGTLFQTYISTYHCTICSKRHFFAEKNAKSFSKRMKKMPFSQGMENYEKIIQNEFKFFFIIYQLNIIPLKAAS